MSVTPRSSARWTMSMASFARYSLPYPHAVDQRRGEVLQRLAFHDTGDLAVELDRVVTNLERLSRRRRLLLLELPRVPLSSVDDYLEIRTGCLASRHPQARPGLARRAGRL